MPVAAEVAQTATRALPCTVAVLQIRNFAQIQRHIRMYGGVATGVSIYTGWLLSLLQVPLLLVDATTLQHITLMQPTLHAGNADHPLTSTK
jgi:hypothetical protein